MGNPSDPFVDLAINTVQQKHQDNITRILDTETLVIEEDIPRIARVDRDEPDGSVIVYFSLENRSYFLMVKLDPLPAPTVRNTSIAPGTQCHLVSFSTTHHLSTLLAATHITPTQQWDFDSGGGSSGLYITPPMPLANSIDNNISLLLNVLEQDAEGIRQLASQAKTFIQVYGYGPVKPSPSFQFQTTTIERIAALHLAVNLEIYSR